MPVMTRGKLHLRGGSMLSIAVVLLALIYFLAPEQLPVIVWKIAMVTLAAFVGYRIDRAFFPYARPDKMRDNIDQRAAMLRRAIIIGSTVLAVALAL